MPSSMTPDSDDSLDKKPIALTPEQAKNRLAVIKQGTMSVQKYFDTCHALCTIMSGEEINESTDFTLLAAFKNGLNDNIRNILNLARIKDAYTARKMAIQEEMFASVTQLRGKHGDEDRIHKMEMLHFMGWEKMRNYDQKFHYLNGELAGARREIKELKETVATLTEGQKGLQESSNDHFQTLLAEIKKVGDATPNAPKETDGEEIVEIRNALKTIEKNVDISYEWIRTIHRDLDEVKKEPDTPISIPIATPPRILPTKRAYSPNDMDLEEGEEEEEKKVPTLPHKRPRIMTATEQVVLEEMKDVLSDRELDALDNENVTIGITQLYEQYSSRTNETRRWMTTKKQKPIDKKCSLCEKRDHHAYDCDNVRTVAERKRVLRRKTIYCMTCANLHTGVCRANYSCWLCSKAQAEGRFILNGANHPRMWCPMQEQFFKDMDIADKLFQAKKLLESA